MKGLMQILGLAGPAGSYNCIFCLSHINSTNIAGVPCIPDPPEPWASSSDYLDRPAAVRYSGGASSQDASASAFRLLARSRNGRTGIVTITIWHYQFSSPSLSFITTIITIRDILSHSAGVSGPDTSASASRLLARGRKERTEIVTPRIKYYHPLPPTPPFITTIHHHRATARPRCFNINIFDFVLFTFLCDTDQSVSLWLH